MDRPSAPPDRVLAAHCRQSSKRAPFQGDDPRWDHQGFVRHPSGSTRSDETQLLAEAPKLPSSDTCPVQEPGGQQATPCREVRLRWMDSLRATAVFLVVIEHAIVLTPDVPQAILRANDLLTPFRIPTLMFLSGLLLQKSMQKSRGGYVRGKVDRILWPYFIWSGILLLVKLPGELPGDVVRGVLLSPESPMWYLAYLFCFYL